MKLFRNVTLFIALAATSTTALADTKAPDAKKAPAAPAPAEVKKEELPPADAAKVEKFFNELADAMVKNQDACPKMAVAVNGLFDKNEAWLRKLSESGKDLPQASKDRMGKRQGDLMTAAMKCKDDKDVGAAMMRFSALGPKKAPEATKAAPAPAPAPAPAKK